MDTFQEAIQAAGLQPPDHIEPGRMYRFPGSDKHSSNQAGWCKLFPDGLGGVFGDWSTGLSEHWQAKRDKPFSLAERASYMCCIEQARKRAEAERQQQYVDAAKKAETIWSPASRADDDHPYLARKGINANGARQHGGSLVIPVRSGGELHSLQFIAKDGSKRFLSGGRIAGGYSLIGDLTKTTLLIAEGFATGATLHQETGYPVVVSFNAGNLKAVALAMRALYGQKDMVICGDNDHSTPGNPGTTKAKEAALAIRARIATPIFKAGDSGTDWNDWHQNRRGVSDEINYG